MCRLNCRELAPWVFWSTKCVVLAPTTWFWVLSFSLLRSFSVVITAGYVAQLAGCGVMPVFCAYTGVDRDSGCEPDEKAKLGYAQQWKGHQMLQTPAFASYFQSNSSGVCFAVSFSQTTYVAIPPPGLPPAAWKSAARIANFSPLQKLYGSSSGVLPVHRLLPVCGVAASLPSEGKSSREGWAAQPDGESCRWPDQTITRSIKM